MSCTASDQPYRASTAPSSSLINTHSTLDSNPTCTSLGKFLAYGNNKIIIDFINYSCSLREAHLFVHAKPPHHVIFPKLALSDEALTDFELLYLAIIQAHQYHQSFHSQQPAITSDNCEATLRYYYRYQHTLANSACRTTAPLRFADT